MPSEKQTAFYTSLLDQIGVPAEDRERKLASFATLDGAAASERISRAIEVRDAAKPASAPLDLSHVPSGTYGVPGGDTRLKVEIDNVDKGKWAGWVFVKDGAVYGEGKRYGKQAPGGSYQGEIVEQLRAIAADPMEAAAVYGRLTGRCGLCGLPLEHEDSVARGIGPVCAKKFH